MAHSLGLTAYRALARRGEVQDIPPGTARPEGELVWINAAEPGNLIAILHLAGRLCANRVDLKVLITVPEGEIPVPPLPHHPEQTILMENVPGEHPTNVTAFLDHWQPDTCVWTWGALRPNLILETAARKCPMFLIDADTKGFDGRRDRWLPDLTATLLGKFQKMVARSDAGQRRLVALGATRSQVEVTSPLMAGGQALHCADSDLTDISETLGGRPVWFAAQVCAPEVQVVLDAHRHALRLSHRLLLILHPAVEAETSVIAEKATTQGLNVAHWGDEYPDENTQVMIAPDTADLGLFFRVAPVSFLGSSLVPGQRGCDPFDAAALGSAVLYGPKVRQYMPSYTRLAAAGAARIVNDSAALGTAVSRLIAPDQAATMAHAGWDVISQGAALTDQVVDLVQEALDARSGGG